MAKTNDKKPISREDDYRDYDERNGDEGWPYADEPGATSSDPANRPYGTTPANFDREPNPGFHVAGTDENGDENQIKDSLEVQMIDRGESDELEARVTESLERVPDLDLNSIEVRANGHTVRLEGSVETIGMARKAELAALSVEGVHHVLNRLETIGVDSHIPDED